MSKPPPRERLDPRARTMWRLSGLFQLGPIAVVAGLAAAAAVRFDLLPVPAAVLPATGVVALAALAVWPYPDLLWRQWRYEIGETEVDLQHGWLTETRTLIPITRIQHVDTRRGPLQRRFGLASVVLYTAAGASEIPALADDVAADARDRIASLANASDDL